MDDHIQVVVAQDGHEGKYVALRSYNDRTPIASGTDPIEVIRDAVCKGVAEPVIFFVPDKDKACLY